MNSENRRASKVGLNRRWKVEIYMLAMVCMVDAAGRKRLDFPFDYRDFHIITDVFPSQKDAIKEAVEIITTQGLTKKTCEIKKFAAVLYNQAGREIDIKHIIEEVIKC